MKPGPIAAMAGLLALGFWLAVGPQLMEERRNATPGAEVRSVQSETRKLRFERIPDAERAAAGAPDPGRDAYRFLTDAPDLPRDRLTRAEFDRALAAALLSAPEQSGLFKALNVTSWWNIGWVVLGFAGQCAFFLRMLVQWLTSERRRESVIPAAFWWLSLFGGVALFLYFVWRRDVVGVMGQSTGIVIYARNIRLIAKHRRRAAREQRRLSEAEVGGADALPGDQPVSALDASSPR